MLLIADNVHFEQFVHNIELLTRFANGIALQSQIYNDFTNTTAYYLKFDKKQFRTIRRLPTGQIYETIKSLYEKSQEIEFDPKMKQVNEGLKWMEPMMKITDHPDSLTLQQESLDKMFPNTEDIEKMYSNLETEWMRNLIEVSAGKNGTKKVKRALDPLVQYTHKVIQISKIKKKLFGTNWTSTMKRMLPLFQKINELEKWWDNGRVDGQFAVPSDLFEPFLKCVTELPQLSTSVDKPKVMKLLNETIQINTQKLLNDTEEFINSWRTDGVLSPESKKMIELGIGHDVAGRFWSSLISLEMIKSHFEKQEFFENLVRIEVNEKHGEFARRWSKSYRNGIIRLIKDMKKMKDAIRKYEDEEHGLKGVFEMFSEASKIRGVPIQWRGVDALNITLIQKFRELANRNDLDFSSHSAHFNSAASEVTTLREFLESLKDPILLVLNFPISTVILTIGALLISIFLLLVVGFFLTSNGRKRWRKFYLKRWGSNEDLEQCWRYSFWTDQISNKNMLCEAVREINYEHVKALVEKGAYINPYNSFGNTPLHASTKYGHVKIVEILLMNGADRGAYNTNNRTPEQMNEMVSKNVTTSRLNTSNEPTDRRKPSMVEDIERLYRKYDNKTFKPRIPDLLPIMAYHVKIDSKITNSKVDAFTVKFKGMVTDQMSGVTHLVVPTSSFGVLITDDFNYIMCVFLPTILMQEQWLGACLDNKSNLRDDYKWRVQNVEYMGKIYKTVVKWARWVHKQSIPYLFGVQFYMTDDAHSDASVGNQLKPLVEMHGATLCDEVPVKENYNPGSHPFHHFHRGPLFIIHSHMDNQFEHLRNDSMFTLMTIHQFIVFMLEMHVKYDPERKPPIPVYNEDFTILNATSSRM
uniref:ANK_REP_REGION domain-containing protein n=1 Tax=Caenorhabditis japonica TaxID=281687 RepID=A0A8R1DGG3_CAEJA